MDGSGKFGYSRNVEFGFDDAVKRVKDTLKDEGFGVLSEIDIDEKLKEKLGVEFRRYKILGACNPPLAYKTLQEDLDIGLLLPCNVVVYEADEGNGSVVAAIDASAMLSVVGENPKIAEVSEEVNQKLRRAVDNI
jgi:uncharacterized protein (DUF302 family)